MKACFLAMLSLVFASFSSAHLSYTKEQVIAYAKSIDVQMLDLSLPSRRLEDWLQSEPVHAETVIWTMQDTCWNKPSTNEDYPLCVEVEAKRKSQWGRFLLQIGTNFKGIVGPPQLKPGMGIQVSEDDSYTSVAYAERLSDLPGVLEGPNLRIQCPQWATNVVVECTTNLAPAHWAPLGQITIPDDGLLLTNTASGGMFFRLRTP